MSDRKKHSYVRLKIDNRDRGLLNKIAESDDSVYTYAGIFDAQYGIFEFVCENDEMVRMCARMNELSRHGVSVITIYDVGGIVTDVNKWRGGENSFWNIIRELASINEFFNKSEKYE